MRLCKVCAPLKGHSGTRKRSLIFVFGRVQGALILHLSIIKLVCLQQVVTSWRFHDFTEDRLSKASCTKIPRKRSTVDP